MHVDSVKTLLEVYIQDSWNIEYIFEVLLRAFTNFLSLMNCIEPGTKLWHMSNAFSSLVVPSAGDDFIRTNMTVMEH